MFLVGLVTLLLAADSSCIVSSEIVGRHIRSFTRQLGLFGEGIWGEDKPTLGTSPPSSFCTLPRFLSPNNST